MNNYEFSQSVYANAAPLEPEVLSSLKQDIKEFILDKPDKYFLALSYDQRYYTIMHFVSKMQLEKDIDMLYTSINLHCGEIIDIGVETEHIEIWYKGDIKPEVVLFFPYDLGVINCL